MAEAARAHDVAAHGSVIDEPLRAELLSAERLADEARGIAAIQRWTAAGRPVSTPLLPLVETAAAALEADNRELAQSVQRGLAASPAAEWLLDNYYLIEEQLLLIREDLPRHYATELPRLVSGHHLGFPRMYEALLSLIAHSDARLDEDSLVGFVDAYQDVSALTIGEVWAVPIMLRIGIIENLRRLSRSTTVAMRAERAADAWAERLVLTAQDDPERLEALLGELDRSTGEAAEAFLLRLSQRLLDLQAGAEQINAWLARRLTQEGISLERAAVAEQQRQASNQVSIANAITSVRFLDALEWSEFFERVSIVEATLRKDPAGTYPAMDFKSRDRYRHAVEQMARRSPLSETDLAEKAVQAADEALQRDPSDTVKGHVGWWLISSGRYEFERQVEYDPSWRERVYRGPLRNHGLFYGGVFLIVLDALLVLLGVYALLIGAEVWRSLLIVVLGAIPLSDLALTVVNRLSALVFPPRMLPKLDFRQPLNDSHSTLVVVPALLSSVSATRAVIENLEIAYLANRDVNIGFGLLGDLKATDTQARPEDGGVVEAAVRGISELNERYEAEHGMRPFHLLVRERTFNESENLWMGWERKRGALIELVREMRAEGPTSFSTKLGDLEFRRSATFILTLDADTILPRDGARKLISTIAHPLNRAVIDRRDPLVRKGHGLVQPRVGMTLPGANRSRFARLYSGVIGTDPYAQAVSDTYQDLFDEGSFTGKGIFEVDVFQAVLEGRFPENTLLSHDLIEGSFLRTALASDIEVLDDYPANYLAASSRLHRWVRGDWQTLPYLAATVETAGGIRERNPLTMLHRWKIFDNLRRSLIAPTTVLLFTVGWLLLPGAALLWPLVLLAIVFFPAYFSLAGSMVFRPRSLSFSATAPAVLRDFRIDSQRALLSLAVLPHQAWLMADAVIRASWRLLVTRKHLLEWETAADVERRAGTTQRAFWQAMSPAALLAVGLLVVGTALQSGRALGALPIALLWLLGPLGAWWVSQPRPQPRPEPLTAEQVLTLRKIARKTWRFYDAFVCPTGHHLAPDNFQEDPGSVVAWRTSPTNIGLQLLSYVGAWDLGFLTVAGLNERVSATLATMVGLERFRGHYYNWYDIRTLDPMRPAYVSTVDSGNLAGHLLVLRVGLLEASEAPLVGPQLLDGMRDAVRLALEDLVTERDRLGPPDAVHRLHDMLDEFERMLAVAERPPELSGWLALLRRADRMAAEALELMTAVEEPGVPANAAAPAEETEEVGPPVPSTAAERLRASIADASYAARNALELIESYAPWAELAGSAPPSARQIEALRPLLSFVPSLVGLAEGLVQVLSALDDLAVGGGPASRWAAGVAESIRSARPACIELLARIRLDADIAREMWEHTDFRMLYDTHRSLFSIGYNLSEGRLDSSYYDLLASECRLASFLAVAKGDVDQEHWFRLGRALTATPQGRALVSWSASMFEYLMPSLVMHDWPETLLTETYHTVVRRQMAYAGELGVPWGISESAFNAKDADLTYQYQAFGVPGLGLKRGLSSDVVVAPYASLLALPIDPHSVVSNLFAFTAQGAEGRYGYYESLDYTPGRVPAGSSRAVVKAYFAHHHGMSFVSIANALSRTSGMQARFHEDPMVTSAELLLQERLPRHVQLVAPHVEEVREVKPLGELPPVIARTYPTAQTFAPSTHFLSNGRYSVMVTNGGGGYSRWRGLSVTRYREDVTRDSWGSFLYVRDLDSGTVISAPHNPCPARPDSYRVTFAPDKAEYHRRDGDLDTTVEIVVSPEDDVEVRRLAFTNRGRDTLRLEVTSYFEIALTDQAADQAHKSFSNLFVETEALPATNAILFSRRPRSSEEGRVWGFHQVACDQKPCAWSFETDRARFLGRLNGVDNPSAVINSRPLSGSAGAVLDPCCAVRREVEVPPDQTVRVVYATGVAEDRETALRLTEKYGDMRTAQRAVDLAWTAAQLELRDLGIRPDEAVVLERLASRLLLTDPYSPLKVKTPVENGLQMSGLWSIGVSGDLPILLVRVEELEHAPLVRQALLAHQYWRHKGLIADLVILNTRPTGYADDLDDRLRLLVRTGHALQMLDRPGGVFLRRSDQMHPDVLTLLLSVARATLEGDGGSIELQLNRRGVRLEPPRPFVPTREPEPYPAPAFERPQLLFDNGFGGFDAESGEYVIVLEDAESTPAPWINVLANPTFGCTVSEAGIGCTWALNSHENRITTWNNDPVSDGSGENLFVRDEETGEFWSPTPLPVRTPEPYVVRHGRGEVRFEHETHGIGHSLEWFVSADDPLRICRLTLENRSGRPRHLSVTQLVEWVLGDSRSKAQQLVVTWFDAETETLTAHNHYNFDFPGRCAFLACDRPLHSWTASRTEFLGRNGRLRSPAAMKREGLGAASGRYHDNCGALMTEVQLAEGESVQVSFLLGQTATLDECRELVERYRKEGAMAEAHDRACGFWDDLLGTVKVTTPDPRLDLLVNGPLLYQATACRLWGRTATYQSSGAFGFRDQLQDVMALLIARPELVREQIVEASRHQFPEGDVLHWWQPYSGRGVRTHISDDRHWLPLVVAEYLEATGDTSVLDEKTAFIDAPPLTLEEEDAYVQPAVSETAASVYEHCVRALEAGRPTGPHGLPLMGGGDWNDGMNRVGHKGTGESVWLAWFLGYVLLRFAPICEARGETERAEDYRAWAASLAEAAEANAWDGAWYLRAYFDDGTPLGTHLAEECRIDAIAQAWATISGLADSQRAETALDSVDEKLVRREDGLIALLTPPFDKMRNDPGYIKGYVPGVRENGGQYTHAALWTVLAYLIRGDGDEAAGLLDLINPVSHSLDRESAMRYKVEPYVVAADVYAVEPHVGRGGWTWYTGSASWFYRVAVKWMLGLSVIAEKDGQWLQIDPCIPKRWTEYRIEYRHGRSTYRIHVLNPRGVNRGVARIQLDSEQFPDSRVPLVDDGGEHEVVVTLLGG